MVNSDLDFCHVTQTGFFITVNGAKDTRSCFAATAGPISRVTV